MSKKDKLILAIDQGTTSSRAILFSADGKIQNIKQKELTLHYPEKGWVEQDPADIWDDTLWACRNVIEEIKSIDDIAALGITNQRETTILWDRETGEPVYNAIVWQDRRTSGLCQNLKDQNLEEMIQERTGLLLDPYFSATKILWILNNIDGVRERAEAGKIAFGTVDSWLLWNLTGGTVHATDATNAARTMLYNIQVQDWDPVLLELFDIPPSILPDVKDNVADFGHTKPDLIGKGSIDIAGMAGDQHAAVIGQACFEEGMIKSTYGTGCFALMNIGRTFRTSDHKLLTTIAYRLNGETTYALEGAIFVAGAAIQWLRDNLGLFKDAAESEALATSVDDNNGVYFVPSFTGLGTPHWEPEAKAMIAGLSRESNAAHITRAALEAQGYQTADLISAMTDDAGEAPTIIRADGGLVANEFVCQFICNMANAQVDVPAVHETTALGAAYLAGLGAGLYKNLDDIQKKWKVSRAYKPDINDEDRSTLYNRWQQTVGAVIDLK